MEKIIHHHIDNINGKLNKILTYKSIPILKKIHIYFTKYKILITPAKKFYLTGQLRKLYTIVGIQADAEFRHLVYKG